MTKTSWTLPLLAALVLVAAGGAAHAIPSLGGPTGIVSVPNALVAPAGQLQTALTYQSMEMYGGDIDSTYWALNVLSGIGGVAELWAAYAIADQEGPTDSETANMWALGGKYQFTREPEDQAALAVGASIENWSDLAMYDGSFDDVGVIKAYIVATKDFTPMTTGSWEWNEGSTRMLGSLGLMYIDVDPDAGDSESLTRPFVGLEFIGAGGTTLGLEYRWKDDDLDAKAVFSAVLRHKFSREIEAEVGTTNAGPSGIGLDDQDFFVRVGYNFPMSY
jgi:hypothetical protein